MLRNVLIVFIGLLVFCNTVVTASSHDYATGSIYSIDVVDIDGNLFNLGEKYFHKSRALLIVNVASQWGLTERNYQQLQQLHEKYHTRGLSVVAFPCNQFGHQEPRPNHEIKHFAQMKGATFQMMAKVDVNGHTAHPLFQHLRDTTMNGEPVTWNFAKFLCNADGLPVRSYGPRVDPLEIEQDILALLH